MKHALLVGTMFTVFLTILSIPQRVQAANVCLEVRNLGTLQYTLRIVKGTLRLKSGKVKAVYGYSWFDQPDNPFSGAAVGRAFGGVAVVLTGNVDGSPAILSFDWNPSTGLGDGFWEYTGGGGFSVDLIEVPCT